MGRAFNLTIPASGGGIVPVAVCGETYFSCTGDLEFSYDEADFNSNQFALLNGNESGQVFNIGSSKTILWFRQPPDGGYPDIKLYIWTEIEQKVI